MRLFTRATRYMSYALPKANTVMSDQYEDWLHTEQFIRKVVRKKYAKHGHCECPYPVGDLRRAVWVEEVHAIVREELAKVVRNVEPLAMDLIQELTGLHRLPPAPKPEPEIIVEISNDFGVEPMDQKRIVNWGLESAEV